MTTLYDFLDDGDVPGECSLPEVPAIDYYRRQFKSPFPFPQVPPLPSRREIWLGKLKTLVRRVKERVSEWSRQVSSLLPRRE